MIFLMGVLLISIAAAALFSANPASALVVLAIAVVFKVAAWWVER